MEFKKELTEVVSQGLKGFREEYERMGKDLGWVKEMEVKGAEKARGIARSTMKEVRKAVGTE